MRRANQPDPATNGQYRIVGDHLGSTSLIVDTTPSVIQRTYYKPYGEEAWNLNNSRLTTVGYTGQRLDTDSGLMFYNARFYDPFLSHFVSADTISPDKEDNKTRHRYSYVLNNPLNYTDPTGHCIDKDGEDIEEKRACDRAGEHLRLFGFTVDTNHWTLQQLSWMIDAINDLLRYMRKSAFNYQAFRDAMSIGADESVLITNSDEFTSTQDARDARKKCGAMCTDGDGGGTIGISPILLAHEYFWAQGVQTDEEREKYFKYAFVHELGHVLDERNGEIYSRRVEKIRDCSLWHCRGEDPISKRGNESHQEDWAETVASEVYPGYALGVLGSIDPNISPKHRQLARCALGQLSCSDRAFPPLK